MTTGFTARVDHVVSDAFGGSVAVMVVHLSPIGGSVAGKRSHGRALDVVVVSPRDPLTRDDS